MWKGISSLIILVVTFTAFAGVAWFVEYYAQKDGGAVPLPLGEDLFPTKEPEEGSIILKLGEKGVFRNISIKPIEVVEDSRCPQDVQCIWAGTLRVRTEIVSGLGKSEMVIELGQSITTEAEEVSLTEATLGPEDYKFTFAVTKRALAPTIGGCYVGGCSSQICSDSPDIVSTCEFRAEYACYRTAKCERQASGECGWSETAELRMCLLSPSAL